jgi:hypothetical protein
MQPSEALPGAVRFTFKIIDIIGKFILALGRSQLTATPLVC